MAAPVIAAVSSNKTGNTLTDITVVYATDGPSGIAAGNLLVAEVSATSSNFTGGQPAIATPSGWTLWASSLGAQFGGAESFSRTSIFYRIAQAGDTGVTFTATPNSANNGMSVKIARITGHDPTLFAHQSAAATGVTTATIDAPSVTTTVADCLVWCGAGNGGSNVTFTSPATLTEQWDFGSDPGQQNYQTCGIKTQASAGATGAQTFTATASGSKSAVTVAIAPPAASANSNRRLKLGVG